MKRIGVNIDDETVIAQAIFDDRCPGMADRAHADVRRQIAIRIVDEVPQGRWILVRWKMGTLATTNPFGDDVLGDHLHCLEGRLEFGQITELSHVTLDDLEAVAVTCTRYRPTLLQRLKRLLR